MLWWGLLSRFVLKIFFCFILTIADLIDYVGCFKNYRGLYMEQLEKYKLTSPCYCIGYCSSKNYIFAATYDDYCYCGNVTGHKVDDGDCTKPCKGDSSQICGGYTNDPLQVVYGTGRYTIHLFKYLEVITKFLIRPKPPINGSWTDWSSWSTCHSNCRNTRNRTCDNPTPILGGSDCVGDSGEESPDLCYGDQCCPGKLSSQNLFLYY